MVKKENILVLTVDGKAKPLRWLDYMLRSSLGRLDEEVRIVICTDAPDTVIKSVRSFGFGDRVEVIDVRPTIAASGLEAVRQLEFHGVSISPLQMFRLALPLEPAFAKFDKVVFCDVDVSFESVAWNRIFGEYAEDNDVLAVRDCLNYEDDTRRRCQELLELVKGLPIDEECRGRLKDNRYYAAGLMVMNLKRMRLAHGDYTQYLQGMLTVCIQKRLPQLDQSLINAFFDIGELSPSYNAWSSNISAGEPIWMRHYPGPQKVREWFYPRNGRYIPQKSVDIVYTIGDVSEHEDQELRWSLRSIAKYGRNIGRLIVTSPVARDWLSDEVIQVDCQDIPDAGYKHHNILRAIVSTVEALDMHGEFLVSSDDHFYVRETDFTRYPFNVREWSINTVNIEHPKNGTEKWKRSCSDTGDFLRQHGLPTLNFQAHANSHWNADIVRDEWKLFKEAMALPYCVEPHVLMQNLWLSKQPGLALKFRKDAKILEFRGVDGLDCISCYDQTFVDQPFLDFMEREFGEKCRYER